MPGNVTQAGYNTDTGQREWNPLGSVPAPPGVNPYGVMGDVSAFSRMGAGAGYGPGAGEAAATYARMFGTMTPQAMAAAPGGTQGYSWVTQPESQRYANGGGANNEPSVPKSTPQEAGENNSAFPGWSTGQSAVGFPKGEIGASSRSPTDPLNVTLADVPPPPQQQGQMQTMDAAGNPVHSGAYLEPGQEKSAQIGAGPTPEAGQSGELPKPPAQDWGYNIKGKPPTEFIQIPEGSTFAPDAELTQVLSALSSNGFTANAAAKLYKLVFGGAGEGPSLASLKASGGVGSNNWGKLLHDIERMETYINGVAPGLNWHPSQAILGSTGGDGGTGGGGTGGDGTGDGTGGGGGDGTGGGGGGGTGGGNTLPGTDIADINSFFPAALARVNAIWGGGAKDPKNSKFIADMVYAMAQQMQRDAMIQQGINQYSGGIADFKNDPLRAQQIAMMSGIMENPDNTPWDTIRANRVSDAQKAAEAASDTWGASAARRMGSAGVAAQPGVASDLKRETGNYISRLLGDLDVQKAQSEREAQYRALSGADALRSSTSGADAQMLSELARMYLGAAPTGTNPMEGSSEAWVNTNTFNQLQNQSSGGFDWGGFSLGLVDSFLGTGLQNAYGQAGGGNGTVSGSSAGGGGGSFGKAGGAWAASQLGI
jgi:hypothetical protein